jgi:hypothetical protein
MDDLSHLIGFDRAGWKPPHDMVLYHGTSSTLRASIEMKGLQGPSYWGTQRVAAYFAEANCDQYGGTPLMIAIPLISLDPAMIHADLVMAEYPIFPDYDERQCEWEENPDRGWAESLRIYESVVHWERLPWNLFTPSRHTRGTET